MTEDEIIRELAKVACRTHGTAEEDIEWALEHDSEYLMAAKRFRAMSLWMAQHAPPPIYVSMEDIRRGNLV